MFEDLLTSQQLENMSIVDWGLIATALVSTGLSIFGLVKSAPIRNNLQAAMDSAFVGLDEANDDDAPSINSAGDLRKISLFEKTTAKNWRKAAERYIAFIDRTNKKLVRSILSDFAMFTAGAWVLSTIASLSYVSFLERRFGNSNPVELLKFVADMNSNSVAQYFNQPFVDIDPIASTDLDIVATFPYAWILGIIGIPAFFSFGLKLFVNRNAKWQKTRKFLSDLSALGDDALQTELDRFSGDKKSEYYQPWFTPSSELTQLDFEFERRLARSAAIR